MMKFRDKEKSIYSLISTENSKFLITSLVILSLLCLGFIYTTTLHVKVSTTQTTTIAAAKRIEWVIKSYKNIAQAIGSIPELSSDKFSRQVKEVILQNKCKEFDFTRGKLINLDGFSDFDGNYRGDRPYFKEALKGNVTINDPIHDRTDGNTSIVIGAPVWKNGIYKGRISNVLFIDIDSLKIKEALKDFSESKNTDVYIICPGGPTISSEEIDFREESAEIQKKNGTLRRIAEIENNALSRETSIRFIFKDFGLHCYSTAKIRGTPGWVLIIDSPLHDYLQIFWTAVGFILTASVLIFLFSKKYIRKSAEKISAPVEQMANRLAQASVGDFESEVDFSDYVMEVKTMAKATQSLVNRMHNVLRINDDKLLLTDLKALIDISSYSFIFDMFERERKVHFCIFDAGMNLIVGSYDSSCRKEFSSPLIINNKFMGKCIISPKEDCKIDDESLQSITEIIALFTSKAVENTATREAKFRASKKNDEINLSKVAESSEKTAAKIQEWVSEIKNSENVKDNLILSKFFGKFETEAARFVSKIQETSEYSHFVNFNFTLHESDYKYEELLKILEKSITTEAIKASNISIYSREIPEETLFGDMNAIEKCIRRISIVLEDKLRDSKIEIVSGIKTETFCKKLQFSFYIQKNEYSTGIFERIRKINDVNGIQKERISSFEQRIYSAFKYIWQMNGTVEIPQTENETMELLVSIPQL